MRWAAALVCACVAVGELLVVGGRVLAGSADGGEVELTVAAIRRDALKGESGEEVPIYDTVALRAMRIDAGRTALAGGT